MKTYVIAIIWLIFTTFFLVQGIRHLGEAKKQISKINMVSTKYFGDNNGSIKISGTHIDKPMEDMTRQINENLNSFIDEFNGSNKQANRATAISYFAAVAVSLFSFCLSLIEKVY